MKSTQPHRNLTATSPTDAGKPESAGMGWGGRRRRRPEKSDEQRRKETTAQSVPEGPAYQWDTGLCWGRLHGAASPENVASFKRFCLFSARIAPLGVGRPLGGSVPVPRRPLFPRYSPPSRCGDPPEGKERGCGLRAPSPPSPPSPALLRAAPGHTSTETVWVTSV